MYSLALQELSAVLEALFIRSFLLGIVDLTVYLTCFKKLFMSTDIGYFSVVHNDDAVSVLD